MNTPTTGHHYINAAGESIFTNGAGIYSPDPLCVPLWRLPPRRAEPGKELAAPELSEAPVAADTNLYHVPVDDEPVWLVQIDIAAWRRRGWLWRLVASIVVRRLSR